jgi:lipoprotein-anchoring transpeptidase ErfK/SrfK
VKCSVATLLALSTLATTSFAHTSEPVGAAETFRAGTIVVRKHERQLYYVTEAGQVVRYPVAVGRIANQWSGSTYITAKYTAPSWIPPARERREKPRQPPFIPGGSPQNPMGVAAMTLAGGELSIHGTNEPNSIGHSVPYGCIRMLNDDIESLYRRVRVGTPVIVE